MSTINETINYNPIGFFSTPYTPSSGAPRQGALMPNNKGVIEIFPAFRDALETLHLFDRIIVLFHFNEVKKWESRVSPPGASHNHNFGLFATRSPKRPNPIGFTIVKLEKIEGGKLYVSGVDAFNGTPVIDIKPYLPSIDCIESKRNRDAEEFLGHHDEDFISDPEFFY
ncbi:MAG: tRNA (N6-threonylcarbamoyladenosine(37)-N6)-methyltransferase TrmO [Prolixibacteraceae bacterium]|nr:tRNA (N6-threonylcarbamoyladenosine(37)-N6)-methyltransferase TrmO [Prolixibacteraceae bacterium]